MDVPFTTDKKPFKEALYEAVLYAFGTILAKYNAFARGTVIRDVGKEIMDYLAREGYPFEEEGTPEDLKRLTQYYLDHELATSVEETPAERGNHYIWRGLYGFDAYYRLNEVADNPFLSCPINAGFDYLLSKHGLCMKFHESRFDRETRTTISQEEVAPRETGEDAFDPTVVENGRLFELARKRAEELEAALNEIRLLRSLVSMCSFCRSVRDKNGNWVKIERYLHENTNLQVSHGLCGTCLREHYPDYADQIEHQTE